MKLFLLKNPDPDGRIYDIADGFVIAAESHHQARKIAAQHCGDEGPGTWLDPKMSTCVVINPNRCSEGVILRDFHAG